jgi:alkyldihydroxyacetonephosphate synthase
MEVAAPWSRIHDVYQSVRRAVGEHVVVMAHLSHAYVDGSSIYFTFAGTAHGNSDSFEVYDRAWRAALGAAIDAGATLSHHHGVGRSKAPRLPEELGAALGVVRALKAAWDPRALLNPGALIPPPGPHEAKREPAPSPEPAFDAESCLVEFPGELSLLGAEAFVRARGHTLGLELAGIGAETSVDGWIARGMRGLPDRYADPVSTPLAGFSALLPDGRRIRIGPAPRRAVGPDLSALFIGMRGAFGKLERVALVALPIGAVSPAPLPFDKQREPPLEPSEERAIAGLQAALNAPTSAAD